MTQSFLFDASGNLPASSEDWDAFLHRIKTRTEADVAVLLNELKGLDAESLLASGNRFLKVENSADLLLMMYTQPELVGKLDHEQVFGLLKLAYNKLAAKMIDETLFEQMATGLINGYENHGGGCLLPHLQVFLKTKVDKFKPFPAGGSFDKAMADHVAAFPCAPSPGNEYFNLSKLALAQLELPQTLEVLIKQQLSIGMTHLVYGMVGDYFPEFEKRAGYIDVFRRVLGDDVFTDLCVQANTKKGCISSVIKLAPVLGEASFHNEAFFDGLNKLDGKLHKSDYLNQIRYILSCESTLPILANYLLKNLESTLTQLADYGNQNFLCQVLGLAVRHGRGAEAYGYVIDAARSPINDTGLLFAYEASREELIEAMSKNIRSPNEHFQVKRAWLILQNFTLEVGFPIVKEVLPDVDAFFLKDLLDARRGAMEDRGINIDHLEMVRMFPQIKGRLLEDALGL